MIYIVLPAYNEEAGLEKLLHSIKSVMEYASLQYRIIVVNDGSKDQTLEIATRNTSVLPLCVMNHEHNRGLGEALKTGFAKVQELSEAEDIIITMDADNTHLPDLIPLMMAKIENGYDLVVASRYVRGAVEIGLSWHRKILSRGASVLLSAFFPIKNLKDYTCGYRAYRAAIIQRAYAAYGNMFVREKGFTAIVEILLKLRNQHIRVCEVPLVLHYDMKEGASKMPVLRTILRYGTLIAHNVFHPRLTPS